MRCTRIIEALQYRFFLVPEENSPIIANERRDVQLAFTSMVRAATKVTLLLSIFLLYSFPNIVTLTLVGISLLLAHDTHMYTAGVDIMLKSCSSEYFRQINRGRILRILSENTVIFRRLLRSSW